MGKLSSGPVFCISTVLVLKLSCNAIQTRPENANLRRLYCADSFTSIFAFRTFHALYVDSFARLQSYYVNRLWASAEHIHERVQRGQTTSRPASRHRMAVAKFKESCLGIVVLHRSRSGPLWDVRQSRLDWCQSPPLDAGQRSGSASVPFQIDVNPSSRRATGSSVHTER